MGAAGRRRLCHRHAAAPRPRPLRPILPRLLRHPHARCADRGLGPHRAIRSTGCRRSSVTRPKQDPDSLVRARAMRALALLVGGTRAWCNRRSTGQDDLAARGGDHRAACGAAAADGLIAAAAELEPRMASPDAAARAWVARVLGESELRGSIVRCGPAERYRPARRTRRARRRRTATLAGSVARRRVAARPSPIARQCVGTRLRPAATKRPPMLADARERDVSTAAATIAACRALGRLPGPVAASELADLAASADEMVRLHALVAQLLRRQRLAIGRRRRRAGTGAATRDLDGGRLALDLAASDASFRADAAACMPPSPRRSNGAEAASCWYWRCIATRFRFAAPPPYWG